MVLSQKSNGLSLLQLLLLILSAFSSKINAALTIDELNQYNGNAIYLNEQNFHDVVNGPRDYYVSLLFTALDQSIGCGQCAKFDPIYKRISASYHSSNPGKNAVYFFIADFNDNREVYNQLQMKQVPKLWIFPPSTEPNYNISSPHYPYAIGDAAVSDPLDFANFIGKVVGVSILINADFEPTQFFTYFFLTFFGVLILKKKVLAKMNKASIFKHLSVLIIVILTSGYMFTVIRGIPLLAKDEKGEIMYFSGGTHWQFGLETFIISAIYIVLVASFAFLVIYVPKLEDEGRKTVLVISTSIIIFYVFNYLTDIFHIKDPGYPYRLTEFL